MDHSFQRHVWQHRKSWRKQSSSLSGSLQARECICRWCEVGFTERMDSDTSVNVDGPVSLRDTLIPRSGSHNRCDRCINFKSRKFNRTNTDCMCHFFLYFQFGVLYSICLARNGFLKVSFTRRMIFPLQLYFLAFLSQTKDQHEHICRSSQIWLFAGDSFQLTGSGFGLFLTSIDIFSKVVVRAR